jgi:hypothetical protein
MPGTISEALTSRARRELGRQIQLVENLAEQRRAAAIVRMKGQQRRIEAV